MTHKKQIHLVGCRNERGYTKCSDCGFTFDMDVCECFRLRCNRKLVWHYWAFKGKNFME